MLGRFIWPKKRGEKCIKIAPQLKKYSLSEEGKSRLYLIKKMNLTTLIIRIGKNLGSYNHLLSRQFRPLSELAKDISYQSSHCGAVDSTIASHFLVSAEHGFKPLLGKIAIFV